MQQQDATMLLSASDNSDPPNTTQAAVQPDTLPLARPVQPSSLITFATPGPAGKGPGGLKRQRRSPSPPRSPPPRHRPASSAATDEPPLRRQRSLSPATATATSGAPGGRQAVAPATSATTWHRQRPRKPKRPLSQLGSLAVPPRHSGLPARPTRASAAAAGNGKWPWGSHVVIMVSGRMAVMWCAQWHAHFGMMAVLVWPLLPT